MLYILLYHVALLYHISCPAKGQHKFWQVSEVNQTLSVVLDTPSTHVNFGGDYVTFVPEFGTEPSSTLFFFFFFFLV